MRGRNSRVRTGSSREFFEQEDREGREDPYRQERTVLNSEAMNRFMPSWFLNKPPVSFPSFPIFLFKPDRFFRRDRASRAHNFCLPPASDSFACFAFPLNSRCCSRLLRWHPRRKSTSRPFGSRTSVRPSAPTGHGS